MKFKAVFFLSLLIYSSLVLAQEVKRTPIMGQVLYRSSNVINEHVINTTSEEVVITDENGRFRIEVALGDQLVFMALDYQMKQVDITEQLLKNNRIVVEVNEKVELLDEVVISPENRAKFLALKNEEFKQYVYEIDRGTEVEHIAAPMHIRGMRDGLNLANIFKAVFKQGSQEQKSFTFSEVIRAVYDDQFFVNQLYLSVDMIDEFLEFCDAQMPPKSLVLKKNEFELLEFLVTQSQAYLTRENE